MGRWAQRTRSGGGKSINFITAAVEQSEFDLVLTYLNAIDASEFELPDFDTEPGFFEPVAITNDSANEIHLEFGDDISAETDITYQGDTPGVLAPQSKPIT